MQAPADQEPTLRKRVEQLSQKRGPGHQSTLEALNSLATNLMAQGKNAEAQQVKQQVSDNQGKALEQLKAKKGPKDILSQVGMQNMIIQRAFLGDLEGAASVYEQLQAEVGLDSDICQSAALCLARALHMAGMHATARGQPAEAESKLTQAVQFLQPLLEHLRAKGSRAPKQSKLDLMDAMAQALCGMGRHTEAEQILRDIVGDKPKIMGIQHVCTVDYMSQLASTLSTQGKDAEAEHWQRQVVDAYSRILGPEQTMTQMAKSSLDACLRKQGKSAGGK